MDAQQFLAEFGHIANAPGGVARLRELVIQLAISGRLVERIESETTTSQAIEAAAELRRAYEKELDLRATRMHPPLHSKPFPVPDHWQWTRLEQICLYIQRGKGPKYVERSLTHVISQKCVQWSAFDLPSARFVADDSLGSYGKERFLCAGDLLWNSTGTGTAGRVAIYQPDESVTAVADSHVTVVRLANCSPRYLWCVIASPWVQSRIEPSHPDSLVSGTTQQVELNTSTARALPIPLPPIQEQSRIVAKVDELMALCDKLEEQQQARRKLQNKLRQSTQQAVASATSPHELQTTWARLADNFGRLFHAPEDVADLRQVILDLAFTGNISEPSERVTSDLVESLHLRKMQLSAEKRIKRETPVIDFPGIAEMLGSIPGQWAWVRLNDIASVVRGGSPRPAGDPKFYGGNIPFLKVADVTAARGMFVERFTSTITEAGLNKTREISKRTVLLTNSGATLGVPAICEFRTTFNDGIAAFIELNDAVFDKYLYLFLKSKTKWLQDIASRGQGQPNLNTEIIRSMWFPLAPISEQYRIVTRVSELMRFCDVLEANLKHAAVVGERVAVAAVASLTGIAIEQEEEPMKAPQTELVAPLRLGAAPDIKAQAPLATILARHHGEMSAKDLWQRFGGEIDAFYAQLKTEVAHGWILEPAPAEMREKPADAVSA
ncbi:MAG: restriction endonuclease subunit S [Azonexus sp.]|nr:restriction endonuclease subunit S [Azonexus sp.]MDZ4314370.1 restriction endonuclease subunit S [Azonexus sp.]